MQDASTFSLGEGKKASDAYLALQRGRDPVVELARKMAELTIPSAFPPDGYKPGDDIPGNNQSFCASAVSTLASKLMFMAFPPGQPIMALEPEVQRYQKEISKDPELYAAIKLTLSLREIAHRKRFQATPISSAYLELVTQLLIAGNGLWRHLSLNSPTVHRCDSYVVARDSGGHQLLVILKENVNVESLEDDIKEMVYRKQPELLQEESEWDRRCDIYSVCRLEDGQGEDHRSWTYWQEFDGEYIEGTGFKSDYEDCPMQAHWLIPVSGSNWGRSYCEQYRGDMYTLEANSSSVNDIAALAGFALPFVKPGSRTSLQQVRKARNLDWMVGSAEDLSVFRSEKSGDGTFILRNIEMVTRRLGAAFLMESAVYRDGERVTKEEIIRLGAQLDRAMGGLYTSISQSMQRRIIVRSMFLHEDEDPRLGELPDGVEINVITGIDAMGRSDDEVKLTEFGSQINAVFGPKDGAARTLDRHDFARRLAAAKGIKPEGLVIGKEAADAEDARQQGMQAQQSLLDKATGPVAGALAGALTAGAAQGQQQQQQKDSA